MTIALDDARAWIGAGVVYTPPGLRYLALVAGLQDVERENGIITSVGTEVVFVRYAGDSTSKATYPADLDWLATEPDR